MHTLPAMLKESGMVQNKAGEEQVRRAVDMAARMPDLVVRFIEGVPGAHCDGNSPAPWAS